MTHLFDDFDAHRHLVAYGHTDHDAEWILAGMRELGLHFTGDNLRQAAYNAHLDRAHVQAGR